MDNKRRSELAQSIISNPLWELMKEELPRHYYEHFRLAEDDETRERTALAHDIFDDAVAYMESQAQMGAMLEFPDETGDGNENE